MFYQISGAYAPFIFFVSICPVPTVFMPGMGQIKIRHCPAPCFENRYHTARSKKVIQGCPVSLRMYGITVIIRREKPLRYLIKTAAG